MQKLREKPTTSIVVRQFLIHRYESITPFGLQSFFISTIEILQQYYNGKPFSLALTSLEEGASSRIYTKHRPSSPGGAQFLMESSEINWGRVHQCITEALLSLLVNRGLDLADTSTHTPTHRPTEHPGESTRVEERERVQFPMKTAVDQLCI